MDEKIKIEKSFSTLIGYCLKWSFIVIVIFLAILFIILAIMNAWAIIIYAVLIPFFGLFIIFNVIFIVVRKTDITNFIITSDTIIKNKGKNELFQIHMDKIEEIKFLKINLADIDPSIPALVIKLKKKFNNKDEIIIFTKLEKVKEVQKIFKKEILIK